MRCLALFAFLAPFQVLPAQIPAQVPSNWTITDFSGSKFFTPPDLLPGTSFQIMLSPSVEDSSSLDSVLDSAQQALVAGKPTQASPKAETGTSRGGWSYKYVLSPFVRDSKPQLAVVVALKKSRQSAIAYAIADSLPTLERYATPFNKFISTLGIEDSLPTPISGAAANLVDAYTGLDRGFSASAAGTSIQDAAAVYAFFSDGTFRYSFPTLGIPSNYAADRASIPSRWGTWTSNGNQRKTRRDNYTKDFAAVDANTLKDTDRNRTWQRLAPFPDKLRIEGIFYRAEHRNDPNLPRIQFRKDGTFLLSGPFGQMVGGLSNIINPANYKGANVGYGQTDPIWAPGPGTYEISSFGLTLRHADGRILRFSLFATPGQDPSDPQIMVINGSYVLAKAR